MGQLLTEWLQNFVESTVPPRDQFLEKLEKQAERENIPIISPDVAQFLHFMIRLKQPTSILEVGTAIGYSTIWMAKAAGPETMIKTIELNQDRAYEAWLNFKEVGIEEQVDNIVGDALDMISHLDTNFDLIFIDAAKGQYPIFFEDAIDLLNPGGVIIADNVLLNGWVANNELIPHRRKNTMVNRMTEYIERVMNHPKLTSSIVPIGDGVALSLKEVRE